MAAGGWFCDCPFFGRRHTKADIVLLTDTGPFAAVGFCQKAVASCLGRLSGQPVSFMQLVEQWDQDMPLKAPAGAGGAGAIFSELGRSIIGTNSALLGHLLPSGKFTKLPAVALGK